MYIAMKNSEFEDIFTPLDIMRDYSGKFIELSNKKIELQKQYFLKNFKKDKDLKIKVFEKLGYSKLLATKDNLEILDKILNNPNFIKLFKSSDLYLDGICKIIYIFDKSSKYHIDSLKLNKKKDKEILEGLEESYNYFKENSEDILDFNYWLNQRLDLYLNMTIQKLIKSKVISTHIEADLIKKEMEDSLIIFSNSDVLFYDYFTDVQYLVDAQNPFKLREKNLRLNFFVRELKNIFNQEISNQIICELTSTIFDHHLDETGVKNILKNANTNPINTQMMTQITVGEENNIIEHFKAIDKF